MGLNLEPNMDAHYTSATLIAEIALLRQTNRELIAALEDILAHHMTDCPGDVCSRARAAVAKAKELHHG
jgi:hypothetical protein